MCLAEEQFLVVFVIVRFYLTIDEKMHLCCRLCNILMEILSMQTSITTTQFIFLRQ